MKFPLRSGLIFVSAAAGLYTLPSEALSAYTAGVLLFAALTAAERFDPSGRLRHLWTAAQLCCAFGLTERFGASMLFLSLSCLPGYLSTLNRSRILLTAVHLSSLNVALAETDAITRINANLTFLLAATLLAWLRKNERSHSSVGQERDRLRLRYFELDEERERLASFATRIEREAQDQERVRIARKLHDDIGHRLIRVKMMMEASLRILPVDHERGAAMLEQVRVQIEDSMEEIRLSVKKGPNAGRSEREYALDRLLEETEAQTGLRTSQRIYGIPYALYPSYRIALYQNARESLTNALRHGKAELAELTIRYEADAVVMKIRSGNAADFANGEQASTPVSRTFRPGMGIRGMDERTRLLGGELLIDAGPPFTVETRLPFRGRTEGH